MTAITSAARAPPLFTMKFACMSDTHAPPTEYPLRPQESMSWPTERDPGFLNTDPHDGLPSGWRSLLRATRASILSAMAAFSSGTRANVASRMISLVGMSV